MRRKIWKIILIVFLVIFAFGVIFGAGVFAYAKFYEGRIFPGVSVGDYALGGLSETDARNLIEGYNNRLAREGINFTAVTVAGEKFDFQLNNLFGSDKVVEIININSDALAQTALMAGRESVGAMRIFAPIWLRWFRPVTLKVPIILDETALRESIRPFLAPYEDYGQNAKVSITDWPNRGYEIMPEKSGGIFAYDKILSALQDKVYNLSFLPVSIVQDRFYPTIFVADAKVAAPKVFSVLDYGEIGINYIDPQTNIRRDWFILPTEFAPWLDLVRDGDDEVIFQLNEAMVKQYLDNLRVFVDSAPANAKFTMGADGKVTEFQASKFGLNINLDKSYSGLNAAFKERNYHPAAVVKTVGLAVDTVEPQVKTADVNNLGIGEIIGVGISTFRDSHSDRIKNIANAVKRLNGTLIKPGEEFSALKYAGPFTLENGFLPEAVIKGREIKNEVGGGMCQIGTTLFRMAMNSGMDITERRNHSLVVGYYADPVNGNPGTDATLYEPILDLKFMNDTGNYLLLQTEIDYKKQQLAFTLWGKADGRRGWYTHPIVSKWIPAGEPQTILVSNDPKIKPGVSKCQSAFRGAVASFSYTRVTATGEEIERVFDSYYRPLPRICMMGVERIPEGCKEKEPCPTYSSSTVAGVIVPAGE